MTVIEKLVELREKSGWTDYRIAQEAGLSPSTVSNIFTRNTIPRVDTLEAICNAFGLTLAQFFQEDEETVLLSKEQLEMFSRWKTLPKKKKEAFKYLLDTIVDE
ncbi:MAG: helix-turn-helix domain-containing protein [Eubacterium sp.]|nr:helix-turn-helix domain-containing protein [Eubacterium sp.]